MNRLRKHGAMALVIVLVASLLGGCWGMREVEHLLYVNSIGIDYKDNKYIVYFQILGFKNIAKVEASGSSNNQQPTVVGRGEGNSLDQAVFNLYRSSPQRLEFSHIRTILFHKRAIQARIVNDMLEQINRYYEFRYTLWVQATDWPIEQVFSTYPLLQTSVLYSQLNDPHDIFTQSSIIEPVFLYKFIADWTEPATTVLLPYLSRNDAQWREGGKFTPKLFQGGVCFIYKEKLKGCIVRTDLLGLRWLDKETVRTPLVITENGTNYGLVVMDTIKPKIKVRLQGEQPVFSLDIEVSGNISELLHNLSPEQFSQIAEKNIERQIRETFLAGVKIQADVYNLENMLYRDEPELWKQVQKNGGMRLSKESLGQIHIKATVKSGGLAKFRKLSTSN